MVPLFGKGVGLNFFSRRAFATLCFAFWGVFASAAAWAGPADVPLHHWSYEAVDRLAAMGLCSSEGLSMRPFTRDWMASKIQEAIRTVEDKEVGVSPEQASQVEEDLLRLSYEFAPELSALGFSGSDEGGRQPGQPFQWKAFLFQTALMSEKIMTRFERNGSTSLLENSEGFRLKEGFNGRVHAPSWMSVGDWFALTLDPSLRSQKNDRADLDFEEASLKLAYSNLELKGGDLNFWWGPGYHGDLILTNNARPLQAFSLRTRRSFELPWYLRVLGNWQVQLIGAHLEEKRSGPQEPLLAGLRIENSPHRRISLALSQTVLFGGKGEKHEISDFFAALDPTQGGGEHELADHLFSGDIRCALPEPVRWIRLGTGLEIYGEFFGEDTKGIYIPDLVSYLGGILITNLFTWPGLDFRFEGATLHHQAYEHFIYLSGYRFKEEFLGHHAGPDAEDLFFRLSQRFSFDDKPFVVGIQFDRERHGVSGEPLSFEEVALTKNEVQADLHCDFSKQMGVTLAYQFEDINDFQGSSGINSKNHIVSLETSFRF